MKSRKYLLLVLIAIGVVTGDQLSKYAVVCNMTRAPFRADMSCWEKFWQIEHPQGTERVAVLGEAVQLVYTENPGAAWGLFRNVDSSFRVPFFIIVNILASIFIVYYYYRTPVSNFILRIGLALVLGGAIGNVIDRARLSYVIDFIRVDFGFWPINPWPLWNIADAGITVGVVCILIDGLFLQTRKEMQAGGEGSSR